MANDELAQAMTRVLAVAARSAQDSIPVELGLEDSLLEACKALVSCGAETARLVALTNLAGTAADPDIEPDILQVKHGGVDFRSLYKKSIRPILVELAAAAEVKWAPSTDPYVSNPYREERIDADWVIRRNNKLRGAEELCVIVTAVGRDPSIAETVLACLIHYEIKRLHAEKIEYRIPPRLTVQAVWQVLSTWLDGGAGGKRLETASVALLRHVGVQLSGIWTEVTSHHVNDPAPYDALCLSGESVHTVAEVKDQGITMHHLENLAGQMAEHGAQRGLVLTRQAWLPTGAEKTGLDAYLSDRNALGLRIQLIDLDQALISWLPLIDRDDEALPSFLRRLTEELEKHGEAADRTAIAAILREL